MAAVEQSIIITPNQEARVRLGVEDGTGMVRWITVMMSAHGVYVDLDSAVYEPRVRYRAEGIENMPPPPVLRRQYGGVLSTNTGVNGSTPLTDN